MSEKLFQTWTPWSGVYSTLSYDKLDYFHMAPLHRDHEFSDVVKLFQIQIKFRNSLDPSQHTLSQTLGNPDV